MRSLVLLVSFALVPVPAVADGTPAAPAPTRSQTPAVNLAPIVLAELPDKCKPIAKQAGAAVLAMALDARIALAGCIAAENLAPLSLLDCGDSVVAVEEATKQSVGLLDEVIAAGDTTTKIIAEHAKGELYTNLRVRMMSTLPPAGTTTESIALRDSRTAILEGLIEPWRERANTSFERVVVLAKANPDVVKNPVVRTAVETSRQRLATKVAAS